MRVKPAGFTSPQWGNEFLVAEFFFMVILLQIGEKFSG